jgi:hypothetical protein
VVVVTIDKGADSKQNEMLGWKASAKNLNLAVVVDFQHHRFYVCADEENPISAATGFFYYDDGVTQQVDGLRTELYATHSGRGSGVVENLVVSGGAVVSEQVAVQN